MTFITLRAIADAGKSLLPSMEASRGIALLLVNGQLRSGGWQAFIECDRALRKRHDYRLDRQYAVNEKRSTLDNNDAYDVLRFLVAYDVAMNGQDGIVHESIQYCMDSLISAQRPNGGWPQQYDGPCVPSEWPNTQPVYEKPTGYTWPSNNAYSHYYTHNDNLMSEMVPLMRLLASTYGDDRCTRSADRTLDFILTSQCKTSQSGWSQQYDKWMRPAWARAWEPPCLTTYESQWLCIRMLEDRKDERTIASALQCADWVDSVAYPDGRVPRFVEIGTNRAIYATPNFQITYTDTNVLSTYSFKVPSQTARIRKLAS